MLGGVIILVSIGYLGLLFAIAHYGDRLAARGRSPTRNPEVYALAIAVACTSFTFYGNVGRAATSGLDFLPNFIGSTILFSLWPVLWLKIIRICKANRITSLADFISSRYGKSSWLGGLVTVTAVVGVAPYIALQLKSIASSLAILVDHANATVYAPFDGGKPLYGAMTPETTLLVALALTLFAVLFGTRHIDSSEHHDGLITAIAFESLVKLFAFVAVGLFVTFSLYDGFGDLFSKAAATPGLSKLFVISPQALSGEWIALMLTTLLAMVCLPWQFYITAVENADETHLAKAVWLFPAYLLTINLFVLPIALAGRMLFVGTAADADMFVVSLPTHLNQDTLALLAYVGGLSASSAMVIVGTIALSIMVCNNLVMPLLLRWGWVDLKLGGDRTGLLLMIRRTSIVVTMLLGFGYYHYASESHSLVAIGMVSLVAAVQFAPAVFGGIYWRNGTARGAMTGLALGFLLWVYTMLLPSFARSGWLPISFIEAGPWGIELLRPHALFGLQGMDALSHTLFWSLVVNVGAYVAVSLMGRQSTIERVHAALFVDVFRHGAKRRDPHYRGGSATVQQLQHLVSRFVGPQRTAQAFASFAMGNGLSIRPGQAAAGALLDHAETLLAGAVGAATARAVIGSVATGESVGLEDMYRILDETSQVIRYSRMLEVKSAELEDLTRQLQSANERLKELDLLKDEFLSTISHELRTPLTSIRAFTEILSDSPDVTAAERAQFLAIIGAESARLTRLIDQILDLAQMEAGKAPWQMTDVDARAAIVQALASMDGLAKERGVTLALQVPLVLPLVRADRDQLVQVLVNLLSNAVKFCGKSGGQVEVSAAADDNCIAVTVADNGPGVPPEDRESIFEKFHRPAGSAGQERKGTGLGLAISKRIIDHFGGAITVGDAPGGGASFSFVVPLAPAAGGEAYTARADDGEETPAIKLQAGE
jgi:signal transduction histidine kinase